MEKLIMAALSLLVFSIFLILAARAWSRRNQDQAAKFDSPLEALEFFGELIAETSSFYVATTYADDHLERISAYGLGSRGKSQILVFSEGVLIVRNGERPLAIDKVALTSMSSNQVAIDKAVEPNGLMTITWNQNSVPLATHIRIVDKQKRIQIQGAIAELLNINKTGVVAK